MNVFKVGEIAEWVGWRNFENLVGDLYKYVQILKVDIHPLAASDEYEILFKNGKQVWTGVKSLRKADKANTELKDATLL